MSNFMKIRPVGAELFHAGRRARMEQLIVPFRNFRNAPKNEMKERVHSQPIYKRGPNSINTTRPVTDLHSHDKQHG